MFRIVINYFLYNFTKFFNILSISIIKLRNCLCILIKKTYLFAQIMYIHALYKDVNYYMIYLILTYIAFFVTRDIEISLPDFADPL